jgi:hypothetical protein
MAPKSILINPKPIAPETESFSKAKSRLEFIRPDGMIQFDYGPSAVPGVGHKWLWRNG